MPKQVFIIRDNEEGPFDNLITLLDGLDIDKVWRVTVELDKETRSSKQNRLQWMWHTEWADYNGFTKETAYNRFKYKYVLPIMLRDEGVTSLRTQLNSLWELIRDDRDSVAALVRVIHTSDLDTAQMAEALTEYDRDTAAHGLAFSDPEDLKMKAMMGFN